ncbi:bifunctional adenosylcobinamide kinase/adenosylcobinamide-phosphate guanylyltransferase [Diaphorobacter aerolatus]|uniref:Bifunctional adenosylcobalamin biosynthesis protein n=1 Tax=Diaphorobacter aerolatus TaxID=1288495 RepID=A0A7H0GQR6_9BURK|nr:bifunctional adenosylcobinamide kinase/adenosylcobinamide-phosphate guanylyltransferase [Diaphorobacter aerolatus]QNP50632.1 bifunctional adenosylcobinamide kinase/adenosylcobinamide-phosphate guanylyltransferase [Diaphorobacter aerolatus]
MPAATDRLSIARSELILGGQKSGKSRRAEMLARHWLGSHPAHRASLIATGQAWDDEMRARIARHQHDRLERVPGLATIEEPLAVSALIATQSDASHLLIVDCLTLWLTNWLMPARESDKQPRDWPAQSAAFLQALRDARGPVIVVGNEIGLGVIPMGREVRAFVDALGALNQQVANGCARVTLMVAGLPMCLKDDADE